MRSKTRYPNADAASTMTFLSGSQECDFVEMLAFMDSQKIYCSDSNKEYTLHEIDLLEKLFVNIDESGCKKDGPVNPKETLFLKNKYLYLYGEGAYFYLQALHSMEAKNKRLQEAEETLLSHYLDEIGNDLVLISLGSANAEKEINCLKKVFARFPSPSFTFRPIDVSSTLLQLAVLNFNNAFSKKKNAQILPIIADFWDLERHKETLFDEYKNKRKIFALLGSTIGNYTEKPLLEQILKLMGKDDILIIGADLLGSDETDEQARNRIYNEYNTIGNFQFLLNPLTYIPKFRGYIDKYAKYFKLDKNSSTIWYSEDDKRSLLLTNVPGSLCYSPLFKIPDFKISSSNLANSTHEDKWSELSISVAQSTKYKLDELESFITNNVTYNDSDNNRFYLHKLKRQLAYPQKDDPYTGVCFAFQKLIDTSRSYSINNKIQRFHGLLDRIIKEKDCTQENKQICELFKPILSDTKFIDLHFDQALKLFEDVRAGETDHELIEQLKVIHKNKIPNALA